MAVPEAGPEAVLRIDTFSGGGFGENGYLAVCGESERGVAVDPGAAAPAMAAAIRDRGIHLEAILLTHAHLDHVEGVPAVRDVAPEAPLFLHPGDLKLYEGFEAQARAFNLPTVESLPTPDRELAHGQELAFGSCRLQVRHAPGHAPGHVLFYCPEAEVAFVGDIVFLGAIGRADLVGGNYRQLMDSIRAQVLTLPDATRLLSGHGPETTVGWERRTNPFLVGQYGGELA